MKVISTGMGYKIYDDSLKTYNQLPAQAYTINFDQRTGFSLVQYLDIKINEKIYGVHEEKVLKVANAFEKTERNLGIILSGDKGIGKSLFAKMLASEGIKRGYPVIIVEHYAPTIADFLNSIEQPIYVLFDEFDKTFRGKREDSESLEDPQTEMLTLFDGISQGKKMFIITCNELYKLNDYLINRPGRFHYHFRFDYPDSEAITEYLTDKKISKEEINKVIAFASKIRLNYDCLRAIVFELQMGYSFEDAIEDLNIVNIQKENYKVIAYFKDGSKIISSEQMINLFANDFDLTVPFDFPRKYWELGTLTFSSENIFYDTKLNGYKITAEDATWQLDCGVLKPDPDDPKDFLELANEWKNKEFDFAIIRPKMQKNIHYKV